MKTIFDIYSKEEIEEKINETNRLINKGLKDKEIADKLKDKEIADKLKYELIDELISITRARIKLLKSPESGAIFCANLKSLLALLTNFAATVKDSLLS